MKSQSHTNSNAHRGTDSTPWENDSIRDRGMHATNARPPAAVPYRRYPSLSDDGQPYFPRLRRARRTIDGAIVPDPVGNENEESSFFSVRAFAVLAIVAIIAGLVAAA